jgi:hypothetical protein
MSSRIEVVSLGRFAQAALESGPARVIAGFERSVYLETAIGLACVGAVGNGPLNAQCNSLPGGLVVGDALDVDLGQAKQWRPAPPPPLNLSVVGHSLVGLQEAARDQLPAEGLGYLIDPSRNRPDVVKALVDWLSHPAGPPADAAGLIGLGPGLTPSGDDLIGGILCALHAARSADVAERLAAWALPLAKNATSRISYAHLACAAEGESGEPINDAIVALLSGHAPDLKRIDAVGHTSGWDALAGVTLALHAVVNRGNPG